MAEQIDKRILSLALQLNGDNLSYLLLFKQFLDDLFMIFRGSTKKLHILFEAINKIHPNIKFTMSHTTNYDEPLHMRCDCEQLDSIPFLG